MVSKELSDFITLRKRRERLEENILAEGRRNPLVGSNRVCGEKIPDPEQVGQSEDYPRIEVDA